MSQRTELSTLARSNFCDQPEDRRKSFAQRYIDLLYTTIRWNDLSPLYFAQHMDLRGRSVKREYLTYARFRELRDSRNGIGGRAVRYNYGCLLDDKLLFERYFSAGGVPVAPSIGLVSPDEPASFFGIEGSDFCDIARAHFPGVELFVKPRFGIKGKGVFKVLFTAEEIILNGQAVSRQQLMDRISTPCLVQKVIVQHPVVARLHPQSLNTLRVVSLRTGEHVEIFLTYLRVAGNGEIADNNGSSRVVVRVDEKTGALLDTGYAVDSKGSRYSRSHPDTGVTFSDIRIPDIERCLEIVKSAHGWLPGLHSVGWDVALTAEGPILLEGNDDWGATMAMWIVPEFPHLFRSHHTGDPAR